MSDMTSKDPTEVLTQVPTYPTREQTLKAVQEKFPGHISWASDRANFSGCRLVTFVDGGALGLEKNDEALFIAEMKLTGLDLESPAEEVMNLYFSTRANLLVVQTMPTEQGITIFMTTQLDDDDLEEFQEVQSRVQLGMREWREERAKRKQEEWEKVKEERRLVEVGRKAEAYNLNGRYEEVLQENKELKAKLLHVAENG